MPLRRHPRVEILRSEKIFRGRIFDLLEESLTLPSGRRQDLVLVDHPGAVAIAAQDSAGDLLIVRQYRHSVGDWLVEIPAGRIEPGEEPLVAARRELEEETGYRAQRWSLLREFYPAPGFCTERISLFLARDLEALGDSARRADEDEELELLRLSPISILEGNIVDAKTLLAAALLLRGNA